MRTKLSGCPAVSAIACSRRIVSIEPRDRSSTTVTLKPFRSISASAKCEPMRPAPPVTSTLRTMPSIDRRTSGGAMVGTEPHPMSPLLPAPLCGMKRTVSRPITKPIATHGHLGTSWLFSAIVRSGVRWSSTESPSSSSSGMTRALIAPAHGQLRPRSARQRFAAPVAPRVLDHTLKYVGGVRFISSSGEKKHGASVASISFSNSCISKTI